MDLNIRLISQNNLSPDEYVFLYIVYKGGQEHLSKIKLNIDLNSLQEGGWVDTNGAITTKYTDLFISDIDVMFAELIHKYPNRVKTSKGETRVLCAKDPNAATNIKAKKRYTKIVKNKPHIHKYIMGCLDNQLKVVDTAYMQNLETWLNNYTWERYEDITDGKQETRIDRKL